MKYVFALFMFVFASFFSFAQTQTTRISGCVKNDKGQVMPGANIFITQKNSKYSVMASCLSDEQGRFEVVFSSPDDSVSIRVSGFNVSPFFLICKNISQKRDLIVKEKLLEIAPVTVKAPKIYQRGDTINYLVKSFQVKTDVSIAQVLKRLPGISVSDAGEISYKGQGINKFYIEGLDLMKNRYGIATNNIDPNAIASIQVLENHQDIKALKDLKPEDRASINLKLKSGVKGVLNLIANIGGGYENKLLWDNSLIAMYFTKNVQLFSTYKGNNSGYNPESELRSFGSGDFPHTSSLCDIAMPSAPLIGEKYYYFNNSHAVTLNNLFRVGKNADLSLNAAYSTDKDNRNSRSYIKHILPDNTLNIINENFTGNLNKKMAYAVLSYHLNSKKNYVKDDFKFDFRLNDGYSQIVAGDSIAQSSNKKYYRLHNHLHIVSRTANERGFELASRVNLEKQPHNLLVNYNLFPDYIKSDKLFQTAERQNFSTDNNLSFLSGMVLGKFLINPVIFCDFSRDGLDSKLFEFKNNLLYDNFSTGLNLFNSLNFNKLFINLDFRISYNYFDLKNVLNNDNSFKQRFVFEPDFRLRYSLNGMNTISFGARVNHFCPAIESLYNQFILSSYRQLSMYEHNTLYQSNSYNFAFAYNFKNIVSMFFFDAALSYVHHRPELLYGSKFDGLVQTIISQPTRETSDIISAFVRASKGFDWKRVKFGAECGFNQFDNPILLQDTVLRYNGNNLQSKIDFSFIPFYWLGFDYNTSFFRSHVCQHDGTRLPDLRTWSNHATLSFYLPFDISLETTIAHYYNNLNISNTSFYLGEIQLSYNYKRFLFTLTCNNIFDSTSYNYSQVSEYAESKYVYLIRNRSILFKIRFKLI